MNMQMLHTEITMEKDWTTDFYINKEYEVLKVSNHIPVSKHGSQGL